jgi:hypothetical protein
MGDADLIDKIIFVAVPQTGTPHAIGALLHGFKEGIPLLASAQATRRLGQNMPSAYNLLPSNHYLALDSRPIITFTSSTLPAIQSSVALVDFLKGSDGRKRPAYADLSLPENLNARLLESSSSAHAVLDAWTPSPSSELFQVAGKGLDTVAGIEYYEGLKKKKPVSVYRPILTSEGDGTVVVQSAWALPTSQNVSRYWIDLSRASEGLSINRNHADILEIQELRDFIGEILSEDPHPIRHRSRIASSVVPIPARTNKVTRVFVHSSSASVRASDPSGNHTGISRSSGLIETSIPGSQYGEFGNVTYVSIPAGHVVIETNQQSPALNDPAVDASSVTVDVSVVSGGMVTASSSYSDISVSTSTLISIDIVAPSGSSTDTYVPPVLHVDEGGDGTVDRVVPPDSTSALPVEVEDDISSATSSLDINYVPVERSRSGGRRISIEDTRVEVPLDGGGMPIVVSGFATVASTTTNLNSNASTGALGTTTFPHEPALNNIAVTYVAGSSLAEGGRFRGLHILVPIILACLIALVVLWFLSCKISKSR